MTMIKKNLKTVIICSVITLLPILAGLILWDRLPDKIAVHFNAAGVADSWADKAFAVFVLPAFMFAMFWICLLATSADPKSRNIDKKAFTVVLWIIPVISILVSAIIYSIALEIAIDIALIMPLCIGAMFVFIGNYMPKCRQNYSLGIKLPWTLNDEDNWRSTHRLAGILWVMGGIVIMALSPLKSVVLFFVLTGLLVIIPVAYSFLYYKKH